MTVTERERRRMELVDGSAHRTELCEQLAMREYELDNLKEENAKLRELARDMNKWLWNGADCTECPFTAECDLNAAFESDLHAHICIGWSEIHDRMCELGIEVGA